MDVSTSAVEIERGEEGRATRAIEKRTSRAPSGVFLTLAVGSMIASAAILLSERAGISARATRRIVGSSGDRAGLANFVGQWAPTLLVMGLYNKLVKIERELIGVP